MVIREATQQEAGTLSKIAMHSKAHWGYSLEFMEACREELSVTPEKISRPSFYYAVADNDVGITGFYAVEHLSGRDYELEALFVEPKYMGTGVGRRLMDHAKNQVVALGGLQLQIQGDPNAEQFYLAAGAQLVGERESGSVPGRMLPLFVILLG